MKRSEPQSKGTLKYGKLEDSSFYEVKCFFFFLNIKFNWEINYEIKSTETNKLEVKLNGNFFTA